MQLIKETNLYDDEAINRKVEEINASIEEVNARVVSTYGKCTTSANVAAKVVSLADFVLYKGARITVQFTYANTVANPTLNVNGTGAKPIWARNAAIIEQYYWSAQSRVDFIYDGEHWTMPNAKTQTELFSELTNNGAIRGIFMQNNQMYVNMDYLQTGTLVLGGANNGNGTMVLNNASGTEIGRLDNAGLVLKTGTYVTHTLGSFTFPFLEISTTSGTVSQILQKSGYGLSIDNSYQSKGYGYKFIAQRDSSASYSPYKYEEYYTPTYPVGQGYGYGSASGIVVGKTGGSAIFYNQYYWGDGVCMIGAQGTQLLYKFTVGHGRFEWIYEGTDIFATTIFSMVSNNLLIRVGGHDVTLSSQGFKYDGYNIATTSALRYKHDISETLDDNLSPDKLYKLKIKQFVYNEGREQYPDTVGKTIPGFIAEDVADIYPSAVIHNKEGEIESWDGRRIIPGMLALIQDQKKQIDELQETVDKFKQIIHVA